MFLTFIASKFKAFFNSVYIVIKSCFHYRGASSRIEIVPKLVRQTHSKDRMSYESRLLGPHCNLITDPRFSAHSGASNEYCGYVDAFPSANRPQRLKISLTSNSERTKKFEFFHWLTENKSSAEMKITKLYAFYFTSGPDGGTLAGAFYEKKQNKRRSFPIDPKNS